MYLYVPICTYMYLYVPICTYMYLCTNADPYTSMTYTSYFFVQYIHMHYIVPIKRTATYHHYDIRKVSPVTLDVPQLGLSPLQKVDATQPKEHTHLRSKLKTRKLQEAKGANIFCHFLQPNPFWERRYILVIYRPPQGLGYVTNLSLFCCRQN